MSPIWTQAVPSLKLKHPPQSEERRRLVIGLTGAIAFGGAVSQSSAAVKSADDFVLPRLISKPGMAQSESVRLSGLRGKWIYLDFWASWCTPCRLSFPWMSQMYSKYQAKGFEIVAICLDRDADKGRQFLASQATEFTVLWDPQAETAKRYGVIAMPSSYLIDPNGLLVSSHAGFTPAIARQLEAEFTKLIG